MKYNDYDVKGEGKRITLPSVLTEKDFVLLVKSAKKKYHKFAFKLAFFCGMRISEIINLRKEHFDRERRLIFIKQGKGGKDRYVPLPMKFISPKEVKKFIPMPIGVRALEIAFKVALKKGLNRTDLHFHNLRHSFATNLLNKGVPITEVQMWLGHSRLQTTSIYLRVAPDKALERYEELW